MGRAAVEPEGKRSAATAGTPPIAESGRRRRGHLTLMSLVSGGLLALSVPPVSWWPLAAVGFALLYSRLEGRRLRSRAWSGMLAGLGLFAPTLFWVTDFNVAGWVAMTLVEAAFVAVACAAVPPGRGRAIAFPSVLLLAEAARTHWPFGGVPLGGVWLGQAGAPTRYAARLGGPLLLYVLAALAGVALAEGWRVARSRGGPERKRAAAIAVGLLALVLLVCATGANAADGGPATGTLRAAVVQGGGVRGRLQSQVDPKVVFDAQVAASREVRRPVDLVLWPEDVISLARPLTGSSEARQVSRLAVSLRSTVVAGVVVSISSSQFLNQAVAWGPDGTVRAKLEKAHRVPFGEYVPARGLFSHLADLSAVPRDAVPGTGPALLRTPAGPLTTLISFEVFFPGRARSGQLNGGRLVIVPTNTSSYSSGQVPSQELSAARLQAVETGRDLLQSAPTGFSAVIDNAGTVRAVSSLGERRVLEEAVATRTGRTLYVDLGDGPVVAAGIVGLLAGWLLSATRRRKVGLRSPCR